MTNTSKKSETKESGELQHRERTVQAPTYRPAADVVSREGEFVITADMPGVDEKRVEVRVEENVLTLTGRALDHEVPDHDLLYQGFQSRSYERSFRLGEEIDPDLIQASMKNGVLRLVLPRAKEKQPRKIAVQAAS